MKKVLFFALAVVSGGLVAQNDVAVTLTSPVPNSTVGPGQPFNFDVTITNMGTVDITTSDTVAYYPTVNGGTLTTTDPNGNPIPVVYAFTGTTIAANGGSVTRTRSFGGLSLGSTPAGNISFCGNVFVLGPNWSGVTESDTLNNEACNTVIYDPTSIGLAENVLHGSVTMNITDNSYYANGNYYVDIKNVTTANNKFLLVDITGKQVLSTSLNAFDNELSHTVELGNLQKGIYVVVIEGDFKRLSTRKIVVR